MLIRNIHLLEQLLLLHLHNLILRLLLKLSLLLHNFWRVFIMLVLWRIIVNFLILVKYISTQRYGRLAWNEVLFLLRGCFCLHIILCVWIFTDYSTTHKIIFSFLLFFVKYIPTWGLSKLISMLLNFIEAWSKLRLCFRMKVIDHQVIGWLFFFDFLQWWYCYLIVDGNIEIFAKGGRFCIRNWKHQFFAPYFIEIWFGVNRRKVIISTITLIITLLHYLFACLVKPRIR